MYIKKLSAQAIAILSIGSLCITSAGCNGTTKPAPIPPTEVNAALEMNPPIARGVEVQFKPDDPNGNLFVLADFGQGAIKGEFHAIMAGEEKVVLRDDGLGGDSLKGDGVFTAALKEQLANTEELLKGEEASIKKLRERPTFIGRERVPGIDPRERFRPFDKNVFERGDRFPVFPGIGCIPVTDVSIDHSLMVTNVGVVEDATRTSQPCTRPNGTGAWTFGKLMTDMANEPVSGVTSEDFVKRWLRHWMEPQTINSDPVPARTRMFTSVISPWIIASGSPAGSFNATNWETKPLDLAKAPFKLTAIVNRLDLRGSSGYSVSNAGEGRFVFEALTSSCSPLTGPGGFTVIFEYGIPISRCGALVGFAKKWYDLRTLTLGTGPYNTALQAITDVFAVANAAPAKPNGSAINQVRTNELAIGSPWELREFHVDAATHMLLESTVVNEPAKKFNARAVPPASTADAAMLANYMNTAFPTDPKVPVDFSGAPFLGGKSHTEFSGFWDARPGQIPIRANRHLFSLGTCSGCHAGETRTTFLHVGTAPFGEAARLSGFLIGDSVADPADGTPTRSFADLDRRKDDLARLMCECRGRRLPDLVRALTFKPINMPH